MVTNTRYEEDESMVKDVLDPDRPRGILTQKDREFILADRAEDATSNSVKQRRYRIRKRVQNAMLDFVLLNHVSDKDRMLIFEPLHADELTEVFPSKDAQEAHEHKQNLQDGIRGVFEFMYRGMGYRYFERHLRLAVESAIQQRELEYRDRVASIDVDFSATLYEDEHRPIDDVAQRLSEASTEDEIKEFTVEELYALWATGRITDEEHEELRAVVTGDSPEDDVDDSGERTEWFDEEDLLARHESGEDLDVQELHFLYARGHVDFEEYDRAYQQEFGQDNEDEHVLMCTGRVGMSVEDLAQFDLDEARDEFDMEAAREDHAEKAEAIWERYNAGETISTGEAWCLYYEDYLDRDELPTRDAEDDRRPGRLQEPGDYQEPRARSREGHEDDFGWW